MAGSWNYFLRYSFVDNRFDGCCLLQDDVGWGRRQLESARRLLADRPDVDLLLSHHEFAIQVQRPGCLDYSEDFWPAWCEDDDHALEMTKRGRVYRRFRVLDPVAGSTTNGTPKATTYDRQRAVLQRKWGTNRFAVNDPAAPWYDSNSHFVRF